MEQQVIERDIRVEAADDWPEERKPGALRTLYEHRELIHNLVFRDIRARYKQSVLGVAWALLQPLAMMLIYTLVFSRIAKIDTGEIPYPIFLYIVLPLWTFFAGSLASGTECLVSNFNLVTKIYFPREVFPITCVLGRTVDLGLGILVLVPLFVLYDVRVTWLIILVIPLLVVQICLMLGIGFVMSAFNLFYRDIRHVVPLLTTMWMYLTPIVYPLSLIQEAVQKKQLPEICLPIYMLNPMAPLMDAYRRVALQGEPPLWGYVGLSAAMSLVVLLVGYKIFKRLEPAFAEMI